jgi:hypothetical protein
MVHLLVRNPELRTALAALVLANPEMTVEGLRAACVSEHCEHLVIATVTGCSVRQCRNLVDRGARVILLAALPSDPERDDYMEAGASAYLPMGTNEERLRAAVFGPAALPG